MQQDNVIVTETMIQKKAYELWEARGCPQDSPEIDWFAAETALRQAAAASAPAPQKPRREGKRYGLREI